MDGWMDDDDNDDDDDELERISEEAILAWRD
jgi:hypothetical protein